MATDTVELSTEYNDDIVDPETLHDIADALNAVPDDDLSCHSSNLLAEQAAALKHLENAAEYARKNGSEDELDDRVSEGETVGPLRKQAGRNTWVTDPEGAFAAVADNGEDPLDVASVSIGDLRGVLGDHAAEEYIEAASYTYFVRR
jgi:hypothetical protein